MKYNGSCLCGKVTFEIDGEFDNFYFCHCERCRKDTGSAHAANLFSSTAKLNWLSGEDDVSTFRFNSIQMGTKEVSVPYVARRFQTSKLITACWSSPLAVLMVTFM